ncbi:MAG: ribbon-helix-helix domain-containing protein [Candidatus Puniceispirillaceae bacterium]
MKKHTLTIRGHATSISLEDIFWQALKDEAASQNLSIAALVARIDETRKTGLSSAIRVYLFKRLADRNESGKLTPL